jgi:uncharacterized Ntn-hydrolase superfamily protein
MGRTHGSSRRGVPSRSAGVGHPARRPLFFAVLFFVACLVAVYATDAIRTFPDAGLPHPPAPRTSVEARAADLVATFSIVAFDEETGDLGVAVQSKFFAVGSVVPFAAAGVGAVATQSYANTSFGPRGLEMLGAGMQPEAVINALAAADADRDVRQIGLVDASGNAANFTGDACLPWAGARRGEGYTVQGNLLAGGDVVNAMAEAFEAATGDLATRLVRALAAGQAAGGDKRGRQSAALLVVRENGGYGGFDDRYIDLRVDDHETPIRELQRLLDKKHGALAADAARRLLMAAGANGDEDAAPLLRAVELAAEATRLDEADGWNWMALAQALLATGNLDAAGEAGVKALTADPWIKSAVLQGVAGSTDLIERLLRHRAFRSAWEAI